MAKPLTELDAGMPTEEREDPEADRGPGEWSVDGDEVKHMVSRLEQLTNREEGEDRV